MYRREELYASPSVFSRPPLDIAIIRCALISSKEEYSIERHSHHDCEIMAPIRNDYDAALNGVRISVPPGRILLIQNGDEHHDCCTNDFSFFAVRFILLDHAGRVRFLPIFKPELAPDRRVISVAENSLPKTLLKLILRNFPERHFIRAHTRAALIQEFCWEVISMISENDMSADFVNVFNGNRLLGELEQFFKENITKNLSAGQIAKHFHVSARTLEKRLEKQGADSPVSLFRQMKMREAVRLLSVEKKNVSETAELLGFSSPFAFSRAFRSETGYAPSEFR